MGTPASTISICAGVNLNNKYDHTIRFTNVSQQNVYFAQHVVKEYTDYTYLRRNWSIKVQADIGEARTWSYLFFTNPTVWVNGSPKKFYYFINSVEYVNDNTVELFLEMDVIQTYLFEWNLNPCFVEREHSVTDEVGENTIDEGLDVGEYITRHKESINLSNDMLIMVAASINIDEYYKTNGGTEDTVLGTNHGNLFGGFGVYATPISWWDELAGALHFLNTKGKIDTVFNIWQYPAELVRLKPQADGVDYVLNRQVEGVTPFDWYTNITPYGDPSIDGYVVKNKKLLQYPYVFLYATNNAGGSAIYRYEKFITPETGYPTFLIDGNIGADGVVKLTPCFYNGELKNDEEGLVMGNFPVCSWNNDTYKMWLAQNQNTQTMGYVTAGAKIVGGVAAIGLGIAGTSTGVGAVAGATSASAGVGMLTSGATDIANMLSQKKDREIEPPQAKGSLSGSFNATNKLYRFDIMHKCIDATHAKMIDDFFTLYGYACRQVKVPNISSRPTFNYVKTIGSNVTGNFGNEDVAKINAIFDHGITFWHIQSGTDYGVRIGDYDQDNTPQ